MADCNGKETVWDQLIPGLLDNHPSDVFLRGLKQEVYFLSAKDIMLARLYPNILQELVSQHYIATTDGLLVHQCKEQLLSIKLIHDAHKLLVDFPSFQKDRSLEGTLGMPEEAFDAEGIYFSYEEFARYARIVFHKGRDAVKNPIYQELAQEDSILKPYVNLMVEEVGRQVDFKNAYCIVLPPTKYKVTLGFIVLQPFKYGHNIIATNSVLSVPIAQKPATVLVP